LKNKLFLSFLLVITIIVFALNFRVFNSYVDQYIILGDINNGTFNFLEQSENMEVDFPNFSVTSMNLKAVKAKYLIEQKKDDEALELLNSIKYDPLMMSESQKAQIYLEKKLLDSMFISATKSWKRLPLNQGHLIWYLKALNLFGQNKEIIKIYDITKNKKVNRKWLYFYFVTVFGNMDETNRDVIKKQARETLYQYKSLNDQELNTILYYILYGEDEYKNSIEFSKDGSKMFDSSEYLEAAKLYRRAKENFPLNPDYYYNQMASLFQASNFEKTINIFKTIPDSINPKNGKFEFLVAKAYLKLDDTINTCDYFKKSKELKFEPSIAYFNKLCGN